MGKVSKKEKLLEKLNKSVRSIKLYDSTLIKNEFVNGKLTLYFELRRFGVGINNLDRFMDDIQNSLVLSLEFEGINNLTFTADNGFEFEYADILDVKRTKQGIYHIVFHEKHLSFANIRLNYGEFKWTVIGEYKIEDVDDIFYKNS